MSIGLAVKKFRESIDSELSNLVEQLQVAKEMRNAISHSLLAPGKRIRPLFALLICRDLGANTETLLQAVTALELIHCSSLIHDDLPALDDDDIRRGQPSCHKAFGEATAILTADALIGKAFEVISTSQLSANLKVDLSKILGKAFVSLCSGQQMDIRENRKSEVLLDIYRNKTGALLGASAYFGASGAECSREICEEFFRLGELIGISFQVGDDYLDCKGGEGILRPPGSDQKNNRVTSFSENSEEEGFAMFQKNKQETLDQFEAVKTALAEQGKGASFEGTEYVLRKVFERVEPL